MEVQRNRLMIAIALLPKLTFDSDDLRKHQTQCGGAGVACRQQAKQQQTGTAAQEAHLLLLATETWVQGKGSGHLLQTEKGGGEGGRGEKTKVNKRETAKGKKRTSCKSTCCIYIPIEGVYALHMS